MRHHLSPRYVFDRTLNLLYRASHPSTPWMNRHVIAELCRRLRPDMRGLEWGSGTSTQWIARRVAHLTVVEHDPAYLSRVRSVPNAVPILACNAPEYIGAVEEQTDESLDFVIVDGLYRSACAYAAIPKIRPGGFVLIDDVQRFVPGVTRTPYATTVTQRSWTAYLAETAEWTALRLSDGVSDAEFRVRPHEKTTHAALPQDVASARRSAAAVRRA